ncbi:MAG: hypothetical protein IJX69_02590 [Oscillospiraceae bacterium]|nr:hypothetical protein [Oscillospiraceae bacterium]
MSLTYRTRRRMRRIGLVALAALLIGIAVWFCWVIWLERHVVYSDDGAHLDFDLSEDVGVGQLALPPSALETIPVYVNEGSAAINTSTELARITGYYIDAEMLAEDIAGIRETIASLPSGTAVMMEVKHIKGGFYYTSYLEDAVSATSVDVAAVDSLIKDITDRNLYLIASVPAFRDRNFGLNHVSSGLPVPEKGYLWMDQEGCYWLDPTDAGTQSWLISIVNELKSLGFDEVVFTDFCFPNTTKIEFKDDRVEAIQKAAATMVSTCATERFAVSFIATGSTVQPVEGRSRLYLLNVAPRDVEAIAAQYEVADAGINLVFQATTNDTRYDNYSVLRPLDTAGDQD